MNRNTLAMQLKRFQFYPFILKASQLFLDRGQCLRLLEDDSLGGGGSRGSGRVRFAKLRLTWRGRSFYASGAPETEHLTGAGLAEVQSLMSDSEFPAKLAE